MQKLAIFDFDGTLIKIETLPFMLKAWGKLGYSKKKQMKITLQVYKAFILYKFKKDYDKKTFRKDAMLIFLDIFRGMNKHDIHVFFQKCFEMLKNSFEEEIVSEVEIKKSEGYTTVLLSGAFQPFLDFIGGNFGFDYSLGSKLNFLEDGTLDYSNPITVTMGSEKSKALSTLFDESEILWKESTAYGDSYYDEEILSKVKYPVAVNPDNTLKSIAQERGWRIIS